MSNEQKHFTRSADPKTDFIKFRVTPAQKALLMQKASDAGKSLSDYLVQVGMERPLRSNISAKIINDLHELAMQQKALAKETGLHQEIYVELLSKIVAAIEAIWNGKVKL